MEFSKIKNNQIVLVCHHSSKDKLIRVFLGEVKGKVKGSRTEVRVNDLQKGLGYNAATRSYEGCKISKGWFRGKPNTSLPNEISKDHDVFHCKELTLFNEIVTKSKKLHKIIPGTNSNRVHIFRELGSKLNSGCHVDLVCINTQDESYNGVLIRIHSIDRKKSSDWIWFSSFISPTQIEDYIIEFKKEFLTLAKLKKTK